MSTNVFIEIIPRGIFRFITLYYVKESKNDPWLTLRKKSFRYFKKIRYFNWLNEISELLLLATIICVKSLSCKVFKLTWKSDWWQNFNNINAGKIISNFFKNLFWIWNKRIKCCSLWIYLAWIQGSIGWALWHLRLCWCLWTKTFWPKTSWEWDEQIYAKV